MPIVSEDTRREIPNIGETNPRLNKSASMAVRLIQIGDLGDVAHTIGNTGAHPWLVRIDLQGITGEGHRNIQAQINTRPGLRGATIGAVLVHRTVLQVQDNIAGEAPAAGLAQTKYAERKIKAALIMSIQTKTIWEVRGDPITAPRQPARRRR